MSKILNFYVDNGSIPSVICTETGAKKIFSNYYKLPWDLYCILLFVAQKIDKDKTFKFYQATKPEYSFKKKYDIPLGDLTELDQHVYLNISELPQVINFLEKEVYPVLEKYRDRDFCSIYGGKEKFIESYYFDETLIDYACPDKNFYEKEMSEIIYFCEDLINFFKLCLSLNVQYEVWIDQYFIL